MSDRVVAWETAKGYWCIAELWTAVIVGLILWEAIVTGRSQRVLLDWVKLAATYQWCMAGVIKHLVGDLCAWELGPLVWCLTSALLILEVDGRAFRGLGGVWPGWVSNSLLQLGHLIAAYAFVAQWGAAQTNPITGPAKARV